LWAVPVIDFDEALGFTVVGNLFGELVIYDHSGQDPGRCADLAPDFTDQETLVPPLLPTVSGATIRFHFISKLHRPP
jgi:hypothetical protein